MSRMYGMYVRITGHDPDRAEAIKKAANAEWEFEEWLEYPEELSADADGKLCGGEAENEFADRLARAVMKANGKACEVEVSCTCLEELPHEIYSYDEENYEELVGAEEAPSDR